MTDFQYDKTIENIVTTKQELKGLLKALDKISNDLIAYNKKSGTKKLCYEITYIKDNVTDFGSRLREDYNSYFVDEE